MCVNLYNSTKHTTDKIMNTVQKEHGYWVKCHMTSAIKHCQQLGLKEK